MVSVTELRGNGRAVAEALPWAAMDANGWQKRPRVVYDAPPSILATYVPLASAAFAQQCRGDDHRGEDASSITCVGALGLGLALDGSRRAVISTEAKALLQLLQETPGAPEATPAWLTRLGATWTSDQCLFVHNAATGWRGAFAEHRLWSAILLGENASVKTPHARPTVRGWFPPPILDDLKACLGEETVAEVAAAVADVGFDGAPDLVLYSHGQLRFVEVKSATDHLGAAQVAMLTRLARIEKASVEICAPRAAQKRLLATMEALADTDEEESS